MNIFVGNLSFDVSGADIEKLFKGFGDVASAVIVTQKGKKTPKSRGFGFVEMPDEPQARAAIAALNGKEFMGRVLKVNTARLRKEVQQGSEIRRKAWPKRIVQSGPRQKRPGEGKPWKKTEEGDSRPWRKASEEAKPWNKPGRSGFKPWERTESQPRPWKRPEGGFKPGQKTAEEFKPWKKPAGDAKPWSKSSERPRRSGFNPSASFRTAPSERSEPNGRGRTRSRKKPD